MSPTTDTDAATVQRWLKEGADVRLLDVRTPAEYETAHIPGAYNVPLQELGEYVDHLAAVSADTKVVTVCQSGNRARQARAQLERSSMQVQCMDGGMKAWEQADGEVRRGRQRWDLERQVRLIAGGLVLAGILGSLLYPPLKYLSGVVGAGLAFAALSDTCMLGHLLSKLPYNRDTTTDIAAEVARFRAA